MSHQAVLRLESLEPRLLLAGDVQVSFDGRDVRIIGSDDADSVALFVDNGDLIVEAFAGTTINSGPSRMVLLAGSDTIPHNLNVNLKDGSDVFVLGQGIQIGRDVRISTEGGNDAVGLFQVAVGHNLDIDTHDGDDTVSIQDADVGNDIQATGGKGTDFLGFCRLVVGRRLDISGGEDGSDEAATDTVVLFMVTATDDTRVDTKASGDSVIVLESMFDKFFVNTGTNDDFLYVSQSAFEGDTDFHLEQNDDVAVFANANDFAGKFQVDGSNHDTGDAIKDDGTNTFHDSTNVERFEFFDVTDTLIDERLGEALTQLDDAKAFLSGFLNEPPVAHPQSVSTYEDVPITIVLTADDPDDETLSFFVESSPEAGSLGPITITGLTTAEVLYTPSADFNGIDSFTFKANDGQEDSNLAIVSIQIEPVNDAPTFTPGADQEALEDAGPQTIVDWATAMSAGPADEAVQNVSFSVVGNTSPGLFAAQPTIDNAGILSFTPAPDANGSADVTIVLIDDGGIANGGVDTSEPHTLTITVTPVNDAPVLAPAAFTAEFTEDGTPVPIADTIAVTDVDGTPLQSATVTITNLTDIGFERLTAAPFGAIASADISYTAPTLTISPAGGASLADFQAVLRSVTYEDGSQDPTPQPDRRVRITVHDGTASSNPATVTVSVTPVNDPPLLSPESFAATYREDDPPVAIADTLTLLDVDDVILTSATVTITNLVDTAFEVLAASPSGTIAAADMTYAAPTLTIAPTGGASLADFAAVLRSVTYANTSQRPTELPNRTITLIVNDGHDSSNIATTAVMVTSVNDPPLLSPSQFSAAFTEGGSPVSVAGSIAISDADNITLASATATITNLTDGGFEVLSATPSGSITAGDIVYLAPTLTISPANGVPLADFQAVLRSITYANTSQNPSEMPARTVEMVASDGTDTSNTAIVSIAVNATGGPDLAPIADIAAVQDTPLVGIPLVATDPDTPSEQLVFTASSTGPATLFLGNHGELTLTMDPTFTGEFNVSVSVSDGVDSDTESFRVAVSALPAPVLSGDLANDTGTSNGDGITSDPRVTGQIQSTRPIVRLWADFGGTPVNVAGYVEPDGAFSLTEAVLELINGGPLADGSLSLRLRAISSVGNESNTLLVPIELDRTPPTIDFGLSAATDSAPLGDGRTTFTQVDLEGVTEPNAVLTLNNTAVSVTSDGAGEFVFTGVELSPGSNTISITSTDQAGNSETVEQTIFQGPTNLPPEFVSTPGTSASVPGAGNPPFGDVTPLVLELDVGTQMTFEELVSVIVPEGPESDSFADIVFVLDESGSASNDLDWVEGAIHALDRELADRGIGPNQFGRVGFANYAIAYTLQDVFILNEKGEFVGTVPLGTRDLPAQAPDPYLELGLEPGKYYLIAHNGGLAGQELAIDFSLFDLTPQPISLGQIVQGQITSQGQRKTYSFELTEPTLVYFDSLANNGLYWSLSAGQNVLVSELPFAPDFRNPEVQPQLWLGVGEYTVTVDAAGKDTGEFAFRILNLDQAPQVTLGQSLAAQLSDPTETDANRFQALAGEKYFVDLDILSGPATGAVRIVNSFGQTVSAAGSLTNLGPFIVSLTGDYVVLVEAAQSNTVPVDYTLTVNEVAETSEPLTLGAITSANLDLPGRVRHYSFTIPARTLGYFDGLTNSSDFRWTLRGPLGQIVSNRAFNQSDGFTSRLIDLVDGRYTLTVNGLADATGTAEFRFEDLAAATALNTGTTASGTIDPGTLTETLRFSAAAGDEFTLTVSASAPQAGRVRVFDRYGNQVLGTGDISGVHGFTAPFDGSYFLLVEGDIANTAVSSYTVDLQLTGNTPPPPPSGTLAPLNTVLSGSFPNTNQSHTYYFTLTDESLIYVDPMTHSNRLRWDLIGPQGPIKQGRVFDSSDASIVADPILNLLPGTYTLRVFNTNNVAGSYLIRLWDVTTAIPTAIGTPISDTLDHPKQTEGYQFTGTAGDRIFVEATADNVFNIVIRLFDRHGQLLAHPGSTRIGYLETLTLPGDGTYYLLAEPATNQAFLVNYSFLVHQINNIDAPLAFNVTTSGQLDGPGRSDTYRFSLGESRIFYFDALTRNGDVHWSLDGPIGRIVNEQNFFFNEASRHLVLHRGDYTLTIDSPGTVVGGGYQFRMLDLATFATGITLGNPFGSTQSVPYETAAYRFDAVAGDRLYVDVINVTDAIGLRARLVDPLGVTVYTGVMADQNTLTLPHSGTYYFLVEGKQDRGAIHSYTVNLVPVVDGAANIAFGPHVSDTLNAFGQVNRYHFATIQQTTAFLDIQENSAGNNLRWELFDSDGNVVPRSGVGLEQAVFTLTPGDYTVAIDAVNRPSASYSFQLLDLSVGHTIQKDVPVDGSPTSPYQADVYLFEANAGDRLYFDVISTALPDNAYWRLIDPNGSTVFNTGPFTFQQFTILRDQDVLALGLDGTYSLLVDQAGGSTTANRDYRIQVRTVDDEQFPLVLNQDIQGTIGGAGQQDHYDFTLTERSLLYLDSLVDITNPVEFTLSGPTRVVKHFSTGQAATGRIISFDYLHNNARNVFNVPPGEYRLSLDGVLDFTGDYALRLVELGSAATPVTKGSPISGVFDPARESLIYSFAGTAGDQIAIDVQAATNPVESAYRLIDQYGEERYWSSFQLLDSPTITLPTTGPYYLIVEVHPRHPVSESFTLEIIDHGNILPVPPGGAPLVIGADTQGTIAASTTVQYQFTLTEEKLVHFDSFTDTFDLVWRLDGPTGRVVNDRHFNSSDGGVASAGAIILLPGDYQLTVDSGRGYSGAYGFRLLDLGAAPQFQIGDVVPGVVAELVDTQIIQFDATAGDLIYFDVRTDTAQELNRLPMRLVDSYGQDVFIHPELSDRDTLTIGRSGTYYLLVEPRTINLQARTYSIELVRVQDQVSSFSIGDTVHGSIATIGQKVIYTFAGNSGQRVFFDSLDTQIDSLSFQVVAPNGVTVDHTGWSVNSRLMDLLVDGQYTLIVDAPEFRVGTFQFRMIDLLSATDVSNLQTIESVFGHEFESQLYEFTIPQATHLALEPNKVLLGSAEAMFASQYFDGNPVGEVIEDGLLGIKTAVEQMDFRDGSVRVIIMMTDEGRGTVTPPLDVNVLTDVLQQGDFLLNSVLDIGLHDENDVTVLGIDASGLAYVPDGNGDYFTSLGGHVETRAIPNQQYTDVTFSLNGSVVWDLLELRQGGQLNVSFTKAILDRIVQEAEARQTLDVIATSQEVGFTNLTGVLDGIGGGDQANFNVQITTDQVGLNFDLQFLRPRTGRVVGTIPVSTTADFVYLASAIDPEGAAVTYHLVTAPLNTVLNTQSGQLRWRPERAGSFDFAIQATDPFGAEAIQEFTVVVTGGDNGVPMFISTPPTLQAAGEDFAYQAAATDPEGDPLTFSLLEGPETMVIDRSTGLVEWPAADVASGSYPVRIRVDDGFGGSSDQIFTLEVNARPIFVSVPSSQTRVGASYLYAARATDSDGDPVTYSLPVHPAGMSIDPISGVVTFAPAATGDFDVRIVADDGRGGTRQQQFSLRVLPPNFPPVFGAAPITRIAAGGFYSYPTAVSDPNGDSVTVSIVRGPAGLQVDGQGTLLWQTTGADLGSYPIVIRATDSFAASTQQSFTIDVVSDDTAPTVTILATPNPANIGDVVAVEVVATDNVAVASLSLTYDGQPVTLDGNGQTTISVTQAGVFELVATAQDNEGNVAQRLEELEVHDPSDVDPPIVEIVTPENDDVITSFVDVVGTATDDNLLFYTLAYAQVDSDEYVEFFRREQAVIAGTLGNFDPSTLANDSYKLRLLARDANGRQSEVEKLVHVAGDLKLGNFTLSFEDLSIPVSGIPITVARTYDSLNANSQGEFGHGWRLEFVNVQWRTSVARTGFEQDGFFRPYRDGTRVYLTLPGGRREGFTFRAELETGLKGILGIHKAVFEPDPGVHTQLSVSPFELAFDINGNVVSWGRGTPYNPADPFFGGGLIYATTREGLLFEIEGLAGRLSRVIDTNGNTLTFTDDAVISSTGKRVEFIRDAQGRIEQVIDPLGNAIRYQYDALGDLISVTDRENNVTRFFYDAPRPHYLSEVIDPLGRTGIRGEYDDSGRLVRMFDAEGNPIQFIHDTHDFTEIVIDALGNPTTYVYDERGNVLREIDAFGGETIRTYDLDNNELKVTNPLGKTTTMTYNASGDVLTETDPLGKTTRFTYDRIQPSIEVGGVSIGGFLKPFSVQTSVTDPLGNVTTYDYDDQGNLLSIIDAAQQTTRMQYNASGNLTSMELPGSGVTTFTYDAVGNHVSQTDALGNVTTFTYDANGNQLTRTWTQTVRGVPTQLSSTNTYDQEGHLLTTTDPLSHVTRYEYDANGNQTAIIDALGRRTETVYDARGLAIEMIYPDETPLDLSDNPRSRVEYDAMGQAIAEFDELDRRKITVYDRLGRVTETILPDDTPGDDSDNPRHGTEYNAAGQVTATIDPRGNRTEFEYDDNGRQTLVRDALLFETAFAYDAAGRQTSTADANGNTTSFVYDALGRQIETRFADGSVTRSVYDAAGRLSARIDQMGRVTEYGYDLLGRLTVVLDANGGMTVYGYDENGNLTTQTDANNHTTSYEYDELGRRVAEILPLGQRSAQAYDEVGRMASATDFNLDTIEYVYDARDRLIAKQFPDSTEATLTYTLTGQRETVTDARGLTTYEYDAQDRLLRRTDPDGRQISYTYDIADNRTSVIITSGTTSYTFDSLSRMSSVTDPSEGKTSYSYDNVGNLVTTIFPNGVVETRQYDSLNRLLYLQSASPNGVFDSYRYSLDATGNRIAVSEATGRRVEYKYDSLYRLTEEQIFNIGSNAAARAISYEYDNVGNRVRRVDTAEGTTLYVYDANVRLLRETDESDTITIEYTYDDNGAVVTKTGGGSATIFHWNYEGRLIGATSGIDGSVVTYMYDVDGHRTQQHVDGEATRYLIDGNRRFAQILEEYTDNGVLFSFVYGLALISQYGQSAPLFFHVDGLGSTRVLSNSQSSATTRYYYDAYGRVLNTIGPESTTFLFAGERRDTRLGVDYLRARYLDPAVGRFLSRDSFHGFTRYPLSLHNYIYVEANPINLVDPSGLFFDATSALAALAANSKPRTVDAIRSSVQLRIATRILLVGVGLSLKSDLALIRPDAKLIKDRADAQARVESAVERARETDRRVRRAKLLFHYSTRSGAINIFSDAHIKSSRPIAGFPAGAYATDQAGWLSEAIMRRTQLTRLIFGSDARFRDTAWFVAFLELPSHPFMKYAPFIFVHKGGKGADIMPLVVSPTLLGD